MLEHLLKDSDRFVVVDVETTGVYNSDRVIEVATVTVDSRGQIVDEWDTLLDPERDVGPTHIHGVSASMVSAAPRFSEVAAVLAKRLSGAVLVAHNISFDARMLANEYARLGARFAAGDGLCTLRLGGGKLADVCRAHDVEISHAHRALGDARATAQLLGRLVRGDGQACSCAQVAKLSAEYSPRTLNRDMVSPTEVPMPYLARLATQLHHYREQGAVLAYLDLLDRALADLVITDDERTELAELARVLDLSHADVAAAHRRYIDELIAAALRDGIVTDTEYELLHKVAAALDVDPDVVDADTEAWRPSSGGMTLDQGMTVCFTGTATYPDGTELPRKKLDQIALDHGLDPIPKVTKSCDLLVASDPSSQSGKAGKARRYGIPIVSVHDFVIAQLGATIPVSG